MTAIAVCQIAVDIDDLTGTVDRVTDAVRAAVAQGAEVVVLPELATAGYVFADVAEAYARAEHVDGPTVDLFRRLSADHGLVLVAGWCQASGLERPYNSSMIIDHGEVLATYAKTHLWDAEKLIFEPGPEPPPVVTTSVGRVATMVCYDLEFPELMRSVSLRGAQLVAAPVNWPARDVPPGQQAVEVTKTLAAAGVNRVVLAVADRCGPERGVDWIGGSLVAGPDGYLLAGPARGEPGILVVDVDLDLTLDKRLGPRNDAFADRRPELYS